MPNSHPSAAWMVAFLRGVNVGGNKRVPMSELKAIVEACGYSAARTLLNSGNVIFRAPRATTATAARRIRAGLADRCAVDTPVLVRTRAELARLIEANPLRHEAAAHPSAFLVMLFDGPITADLAARITSVPFTVERAAVGEDAVYFSLPAGISTSKPFEQLGRQLGAGVTSRNWTTMNTLLEMMGDA
ncbi:MAG: DUF1697 domain-containing protein [Gemmatimonadaceae bacterium]|nr:DUF1697 domain-containing protein [Gemmatimonadaceae bacterium]